MDANTPLLEENNEEKVEISDSFPFEERNVNVFAPNEIWQIELKDGWVSFVKQQQIQLAKTFEVSSEKSIFWKFCVSLHSTTSVRKE